MLLAIEKDISFDQINKYLISPNSGLGDVPAPLHR